MLPPTLTEISTEIAALEEAIALRGRLLQSSQRRHDWDPQAWHRDAQALARLLKRLRAEREALARELQGR